MTQTLTDTTLADQLLRIAREPTLRQEIYERLGEYCHQCRNRLNSLKLGLYLARRLAPPEADARWEMLDRDYLDLERRIEQIQLLCRPLTLSRVTLDLELLLEDRYEHWHRLMARTGKQLEFARPAERAVVGFDVERLGQCLDALVDWRASDRAGGSDAVVRWWADAGFVHLVWEEAGKASAASDPAETSPGATWVLPLLGRIISAHDGELSVDRDRGFRLELSWPS